LGLDNDFASTCGLGTYFSFEGLGLESTELNSSVEVAQKVFYFIFTKTSNSWYQEERAHALAKARRVSKGDKRIQKALRGNRIGESCRTSVEGKANHWFTEIVERAVEMRTLSI
jgi:hypothetical protein